MVIRTTGDELSIDLDLSEGKVVKAAAQGPFRPEIVDRNGDIVEPKLPCDIFHEIQVANDVDAVDFDDHPVERRVIWDLSAKGLHRFWILKEGDWQVNCDLIPPCWATKLRQSSIARPMTNSESA